MKKFGFTLAEILLTLGIIGIVAAITAPTLSGLIPDKMKVAVIKYHKLISDINADLLNDKSLYIKSSIGDTEKPYEPKYSDINFEKETKYPILLTKKLTLDEDITTTISTTTSKFSTTDGYAWTIDYDEEILPTDRNSMTEEEKKKSDTDKVRMYTITIDTNGEDEPNSLGKVNCKNPDQFKFIVYKNGDVIAHPDDKLTEAYLNNPFKLNDKKADYETAFGDK